MKLTKRIFLPLLAVVLILVSTVGTTVSWYPHKDNANGKKMNYIQDLPVSVKSGSGTISMNTYISDANGEATNETVSAISVAAGNNVVYYKTVFQNSGSNDVYVNLETSELGNNADFYIGTVAPTINEKAYASRPQRTKVSDTSVRVYFKTINSFSDFWGTYAPSSFFPNNPVGGSNGTTNDFNIAYTEGGAEHLMAMTQCPTEDNTATGNEKKVYYADIPSSADSFYFFNHWYLCSDSNREWNRTLDFKDLSGGRLYYLTGNKVDEKWKECSVKDTDTNLVAVNQHYQSVRMSSGAGVFADIGLKKTGDADGFVPEYYGASISYRSADNQKCTVSRDGLITPTGTGDTTVTTTITGKYGDTAAVTTNVSIPSSINQVPVIQNVRVAAGEKATIDWYALNKSPSSQMTTSALYYTL